MGKRNIVRLSAGPKGKSPGVSKQDLTIKGENCIIPTFQQRQEKKRLS